MTNSPTPHTDNSTKINFRGAPINPISVDVGHPKLTIRIPSLVHSHYSKESATTDFSFANILTCPNEDSWPQNKDDHRAKRKKLLIRCVQRLASPPPVSFRSLNEEARATIQRSQSTAGLDLHYVLIDMDARFEGEGKQKEVTPALGGGAFAPETIPSNVRHPTAKGRKIQSENDASSEAGIMVDDELFIVASTSSSASSTRQGSNTFMSDDYGAGINPYSSPHPQDEPITQSSFWSPFSYFPRHLIDGPEMTTQAATSSSSASSSPFSSIPPPLIPLHSAFSGSLPSPRSDYPTPPLSESPCESPTRIPTFNYYENSLNKLLASNLDDLTPNAPSVLYEPQARSIGKMKMTHLLPATLAVQSEKGQGSNGITSVASEEEDIIMRDNVYESGSTVSVNVVNRSKQGRESSRNASAEGVMDPDAKVESELCPDEVGVQNEEEFTNDEDYVLNHFDLVYPSD